jgi:hypothetical protein
MRKLLVVTALLLFAGIAFGQTLKKGSVLGFHTATITLNPDVTMDQYLDFYLNKYIPEVNKAFPGVHLFISKGNRGDNENGYALVWYIESLELRDKLWPEKDVTSEIVNAAAAKIQPLITELNSLGTMTSEHTDWVIL